ncbi:hypothetical protein BJV77DRAFT_1068760 [Russula vinacea]|nr:hypothetical protein BJV77DRAFT_1068760 [Russula vinacea]
MDIPRSPHFAAAPPSPFIQNSNTSAPGRDISSNRTSGTDPQSQPPRRRPQSPSGPPLHTQHTPTTPAQTFRAPAHKHAHHLHSIPPREKSTRTQIIDYLLWVHARTRLSRPRPEQWDENEEVHSEGEQEDVDGRALRACSSGPEHVDGQDDENGLGMSAMQDLPFARRLRQRADSLENVVTSMLEQPPSDIPSPENEPFDAPPLQQPPPPVTPSSVGKKHIFPNGVRLRLALNTVINDLFARQPPVDRHSHFQDAVPAASSSASGSDSGLSSPHRPMQTSLPSSTPSPVSLPWLLPQSLVPLLSVSRTGTTSTPPPRVHNPAPTGGKPHGIERTHGAGWWYLRFRGRRGHRERACAAENRRDLLRRGTVPPRPLLQDDETTCGAHPAFVRLSALVALELGREVSAEEIGPAGSGPDNNRHREAGVALVPTVQWYFLLAGLLTRAVLEGYLTAEWRGLAPLQVLLSFGLDGAAIPHDVDDRRRRCRTAVASQRDGG